MDYIAWMTIATQSVKIGSDGVSLHLPLMNVDIHLIKVEDLLWQLNIVSLWISS